MAAPSTNINRLRIATPCPISWDQMTGDNRVRFCDQCQLNVYNISELSCIEAESLIGATEGRICARLFRRADGTVLTKDCPVGLRALRLRVSKRAAAVFAAIASLAGATLGQNPAGKDGKISCTQQTKITHSNAPSDPAAKVLSGTVMDPSRGAIAGAKITVLSMDAKEIVTTSTNEEGRFEVELPVGVYAMSIQSQFFKPLRLNNVTVKKDTLTNLDLILQPSKVVEFIGVVDTSMFDTTPGTTIISGDHIRRLPIQK